MSFEFLVAIGWLSLLLVALLVLAIVVGHLGKREPFAPPSRRERESREREYQAHFAKAFDALERDALDGGGSGG